MLICTALRTDGCSCCVLDCGTAITHSLKAIPHELFEVCLSSSMSSNPLYLKFSISFHGPCLLCPPAAPLWVSWVRRTSAMSVHHRPHLFYLRIFFNGLLFLPFISFKGCCTYFFECTFTSSTHPYIVLKFILHLRSLRSPNKLPMGGKASTRQTLI